MNYQDNPAFLLIHGAWHDEHTWSNILPSIEKAGYAATALTLPGAGKTAKNPQSYNASPFNPKTYATEPSPNATVTQEMRDAAALAEIKKLQARGNGKVILVGHSLGGLTVSSVAEQYPDEVSAVVYVAAFLLPKGIPAVAMILSEIMSAAIVPSLFCADPQVIGALRLNPNSTDAEYLSRLKAAFYDDLSNTDFHTVRKHLHPDEPVGVAAVPSIITKEKFGSLPRAYIHCTKDNAIPYVAQQHMVDITNAELGNKAKTFTLNCSHSPFYAEPKALTEIFVEIALST